MFARSQRRDDVRFSTLNRLQHDKDSLKNLRVVETWLQFGALAALLLVHF